MQTIAHDPEHGVYATTRDYIHALEVRDATRTLHVSGTMGLDADGGAPATLAEQLALVWDNVRAILAAAGMTLDQVVRVTSYLRDAADAEASVTCPPTGSSRSR